MPIDAKLKAEWDKRLRDSGFVDIERSGGRLVDEVQFNNLHLAKGQTMSEFDSHRRYYEVAQHLVEQDLSEGCWLADVALPAATQALVRALHAEGISNREMERRIGVSKYLIGKVVKAFAEQIRMEIKNEKAETGVP